MDWDDVRVFLAVARSRRFVAAAKRLKLDHATVSRHIATLEETVGAIVRPAHDGAKLPAPASASSRRRANGKRVSACAGRNLRRQSRTHRRRAHRRAGRAFDLYLVSALRDFAERHPGVHLRLMPLPQLTPLARREVDVVIGLDKPEAGRSSPAGSPITRSGFTRALPTSKAATRRPTSTR